MQSFTTTAGSSLASVISVPDYTLFHKVTTEDAYIPAQLHQKFWGKPIMEEIAWRTYLKKGGREDEDQDQDVRTFDDTHQDQDDDQDETSDGEDDIIPGCCALDFGHIDRQSIWIRADYIRIYDYIEGHYNKHAKRVGRAPSAVVTGEPGVGESPFCRFVGLVLKYCTIGKSVWIYYALLRRISERKAVIWLYNEVFYLFVEDGIYEMPPKFQTFNFLSIVWTLVDSDQNKDGVPPALVAHGTSLFVIYSTSPAKERWSRLDKTTHTTRLIMNPWTRKEILRVRVYIPSSTDAFANFLFSASMLLPDEPTRETRVNEVFDLLGPTPRLCIDYLLNPDRLREYQDDLQKTILETTTSQLKSLFKDAAGLKMDAISHKLCLLARRTQEDVHSEAVVAPITHAVQSRLANQYRKVERAEKINLYTMFSRARDSRIVAGIFFEAIAQDRFQEGNMELELVPMVRLEASKRKRSNDGKKAPQPQWYSSHILLHDKSLEVSRKHALKQQLMVKINPSAIEEYSDDVLASIKPDVFYVPESTNRKALDSFTWIDGILYIFQFTIAPNHRINRGPVDFAEKHGFPPMDDWRFVFVIPPNLTLISPRPPKPFPQELHPYSAVFQI